MRLTRCVGPTHALDMMLRARKIDGEHALRIGLVSEVHPVAELKARAHELALELARGPRTAVAGVMNVVGVTLDGTLDEALDAERDAVHACGGSADSAEGRRAFMEKRPPVFL